jgi:hypothetical protein
MVQDWAVSGAGITALKSARDGEKRFGFASSFHGHNRPGGHGSFDHVSLFCFREIRLLKAGF